MDKVHLGYTQLPDDPIACIAVYCSTLPRDIFVMELVCKKWNTLIKTKLPIISGVEKWLSVTSDWLMSHTAITSLYAYVTLYAADIATLISQNRKFDTIAGWFEIDDPRPLLMPKLKHVSIGYRMTGTGAVLRKYFDNIRCVEGILSSTQYGAHWNYTMDDRLEVVNDIISRTTVSTLCVEAASFNVTFDINSVKTLKIIDIPVADVYRVLAKYTSVHTLHFANNQISMRMDTTTIEHLILDNIGGHDFIDAHTGLKTVTISLNVDNIPYDLLDHIRDPARTYSIVMKFNAKIDTWEYKPNQLTSVDVVRFAKYVAAKLKNRNGVIAHICGAKITDDVHASMREIEKIPSNFEALEKAEWDAALRR